MNVGLFKGRVEGDGAEFVSETNRCAVTSKVLIRDWPVYYFSALRRRLFSPAHFWAFLGIENTSKACRAVVGNCFR